MKNKKGISLIVLIITIVVIIVLATAIIVNIAQSNIINNSKAAVVKQDFATMIDELNMYISDKFVETKGKFKAEDLNATTKEEVLEVIPSLKNTKYEEYVQIQNGKIVLKDGMDANEKEWAMEVLQSSGNSISSEPITTAEVAQKAESIYGKTINYKTGNSQIDSETTWQILHSDGNNIYIIAKDYIPTQNAPATSSGYSVIKSGYEYRCSLLEVANDYNGTSDITTSNPARNWLSDYLESYSNNRTIGKATAYLLDTNLWNSLYKGENAKYAIGAPTIELIVDSYNKTHDENATVAQLYSHVNEEGYYIGAEENSTVGYVSYINSAGEYNSLYIINNADKTLGYYIASPSAFVQEKTNDETGTVTYTYNMLIGYYSTAASGYDEDYNGGIWNDSLEGWGNLGLRPVVCLEDNISIQLKSDGTYDIIK